MSRLEFFKTICEKYNSSDLADIQKAYWFSKNVHRPQKRNDGERYFEHPLRVAKKLFDEGYVDCNIIITAFLHDVVEDTFTPPNVIVDLFGTEIWSNVTTLSKNRPVLDPVTMEKIGDVKVEKEQYFEKIISSNKAVRLVKVADRIDNTTDLKLFEPSRREKYVLETINYILPIAKDTDPVLLKELNKNIEPYLPK